MFFVFLRDVGFEDLPLVRGPFLRGGSDRPIPADSGVGSTALVPLRSFPSNARQRSSRICIQVFDGIHMAQLIVTEKIDGSPVAWRCSVCDQSFSAGRELSSQERLEKVTAEFNSHISERHKGESAKPMAFAAAVPLPKERA